MWVKVGIGIRIGILIIPSYILLRKKIVFIEITKLISKLLCQFFVVFAVQDLIYAILTESFHNNVSKNKTHLIGLFYDNPLENEWFWLILAVSLTYYYSQFFKTRCRIERDIKNNDILEKLLEPKVNKIDEAEKSKQGVKGFFANLEVGIKKHSS